MSDEYENQAKSFLLGISSDESWIDASSGYGIKQLAELLEETYKKGVAKGHAEARADEEWVRAHERLGVWPGAYDD
jgi:hypothetical protein